VLALARVGVFVQRSSVEQAEREVVSREGWAFTLSRNFILFKDKKNK
jgi:hypothetical protein